jgi:hypothetical protein
MKQFLEKARRHFEAAAGSLLSNHFVASLGTPKATDEKAPLSGGAFS